MNVSGESSQLTGVTPVVEPSFGDSAASASSRNRRSFGWHPINGIHGGCRIRWRCKRRKSLVSGVDV